MKTYEYKLIVETSEEKLSSTVNDSLASGWQLYKGPVISIHSLDAYGHLYSHLFGQALKKEKIYPGAWG